MMLQKQMRFHLPDKRVNLESHDAIHVPQGVMNPAPILSVNRYDEAMVSWKGFR
jgi:hypothetical protein